MNELFTALPQESVGSLTFEGLAVEDRIAAVTLRQGANRHGEPLYSTLPVADIDQDGLPDPGGQSLLVFPQVGAGQGLSTQLVLISRGQTTSRGTIRFIASDGKPLVVRSSSGTAAEFPFELPGQGVFFSEFTSRERSLACRPVPATSPAPLFAAMKRTGLSEIYRGTVELS